MSTLVKIKDALFSADGRMSYRRLVAFAAATGLLIGSRLGEENWMIVCLAFMGLEGAVALVGAIKPSTPKPTTNITNVVPAPLSGPPAPPAA